MRYFVFGIVFFVLFAACSTRGYESKDEGLGSYLMKMMKEYGDSDFEVTIPESLDSVRWKLKEDPAGFQVLVEKEHFNDLKGFIETALGEPYQVVEDSAGNEQIYYHIREVGFALRYGITETIFGAPKYVHIIMLRPN